jgi:hypothetical protein
MNEDFGLGINFGNENVGADSIRPNAQKQTPRADNIRPYETQIAIIKRKAAERELIDRVRRILWEYECSLRKIRREYISKDLWIFSLHNLDYAEYITEHFDSLPREKQIELIKNERKKLIEYERFNRNIERVREC